MSPIRASRRPVVPAAVLAAVLAALASGPGPSAAQEDPPAEAAPKPRPKPRASAPRAEPKAEHKRASRPAPAAAAVWPPGALSISESYDAWTLSCTRSDTGTTCTLVQAQGDAKTGRRQFAFELRTPRDGRSEGLVLMPFGLALDAGVTFKLDDAVLGKGAPYVSCGNEGCLVPISFPTLATDAMRTARTLVVIGQKPGTDDAQPITVPLGGFAPVWDRAIAFSN